MLLRDDLQTALNEVEARCIEAAGHFASAARLAAAEAAAPLFASLAQRRSRLAADLATHIRALDDLPQAPDPDRQLIGDMVSGLKSLFSSDAVHTLIDERLAFEQLIAEAVAQARRQPMPQAVLLTLERIEADVRLAQRQLAEARDAPGHVGPGDA